MFKPNLSCHFYLNEPAVSIGLGSGYIKAQGLVVMVHSCKLGRRSWLKVSGSPYLFECHERQTLTLPVSGCDDVDRLERNVLCTFIHMADITFTISSGWAGSIVDHVTVRVFTASFSNLA